VDCHVCKRVCPVSAVFTIPLDRTKEVVCDHCSSIAGSI
jgi:Fe-S-cluster-containing hydrogenase component 2